MANLDQYLSHRRGRQAELAKRLNLGAGTLSSIRSGQRRPSPELAKRIEAATEGEVRAAVLLGLEEARTDFDHELGPRRVSDGRWSVRVGPDGGVSLSPAMVEAFGFAPGERLLFKVDGGRVTVHSTDVALRTIQAEFQRLVPDRDDVVGDFLADKRAEASRE